MAMSGSLFSLFFPVIFVMLIMQLLWKRIGRKVEGWRFTLISALLSLIVVLIPIGGIPLFRYVNSLIADFSIPFTALLFAEVWKRASGKELLDNKAVKTTRLFGIFAGIILYPMALGLGSWDPYLLGWAVSWLFLLLMVVAIVFLLRGNRFGIVLLLAIAAYHLGIFETTNLWDYFIDPVYVLASIIALFRSIMFPSKKHS